MTDFATALVTGGGGFLGGAIVRRLLDRGIRVRSFSRGAYPDLEAAGVECVRGDLADAAAVADAVRGTDIVFHVAALPGIWGPAAAYEKANVLGTRHVLDACRAAGVGRLVYTSSPSVVFDGTDEEGIDESHPYPERYLAHYPRTKAIAEREVLAAHGPDLATVSLRPHLVWGPGDNHLVPRLLERARAGQLALVGDGSNLVDSTYVDNGADAHLAAADRLAPDAACGGKAYFVSNGEPLAISDLMNRLLAAGGLGPIEKRVPRRIAYAAGTMMEIAYRLRGKTGTGDEPRMTRFLALQLSRAHWYDIGAAKRDLGWEPAVTIDEGLERLAADLSARATATA